MDRNWTAESLRAFELDIADIFNSGQIKAPVHLSGGNEQQLIEIFKQINPQDWIFTTWRSHYHCLLKGVPPNILKADIVAGKSITLTYPDFNIFSSAIVGGILPIALGVAWSIKHRGRSEKVWVFIGDMTSFTGACHECRRYARGHTLPIRFVCEWNNLSVCTGTLSVWGMDPHPADNFSNYTVYSYKLPWPHAGAGKRVQF